MEDFLARYPLYVVLLIVLTIWAGIAGFMLLLERKLRRLEAGAESGGADGDGNHTIA